MMDRKWIAGIVVVAVVALALIYFNANPASTARPDAAAANPALTGTADPAPRP